MALTQHAAELLTAITSAPHQVLVVGDDDGVLHQMLYTSWKGWFAGCESFQASSMSIGRLRYGKPTCFHCMADEKPDPKEVGGSERVLKLYSETKGNHTHCVMFTGNKNETLANIGGFTALEFEWREIRAALVLGCKALGIRIVLEEKEG